MSFKTITVMLLLSCLGATSTSLGETKETPPNALPPLTITEVRWLMNETSTTVQICASEVLPDGRPQLVYDDGTSNSVNVEGVIDVNPNCANFSKEGTYKYNENPSRYQLMVVSTSDPGVFVARGDATLTITVKTTLLTCGGSHVTKITWNAGEELPVDFNCLESISELDNVCYRDEDLTGTEFCFGVKDGADDVNVCLNGPTDSTPNSKGSVSMNYFYYGPDAVSGVPADATLSLAMGTEDLAKLRVIVRLAEDPEQPGETQEATIYDCSTTECTFVTYVRKHATFDVCVEAMDDSLATLETATTTFTDMDLHAFDEGSEKSMLLELVFANGLDGMSYKASLYQDLPADVDKDLPADGGGDKTLDAINLDCTRVSAGHACFGFLNTGSGEGIVYLTLSAMDGSNSIIVPYAIPSTPGLLQE